MTVRSLIVAWGALLLLSLGSAVLAQGAGWSLWPVPFAVIVMGLAWFKARIILLQYLKLSQAPSWRRGFQIVSAFMCLLLLASYLAPLAL